MIIRIDIKIGQEYRKLGCHDKTYEMLLSQEGFKLNTGVQVKKLNFDKLPGRIDNII